MWAGGGMRMEKDFAWGNEHTVQCADDDLIELYTGNLYGS